MFFFLITMSGLGSGMVRGTQLTTKLKDLLVKYPHYLTNWHNLYTYIYVLCTLHATDFETSRHNKYITTSVGLWYLTWHLMWRKTSLWRNLVTHQLGLSTNEIGWTSWKDCTKISASGLQLMIPWSLKSE